MVKQKEAAPAANVQAAVAQEPLRLYVKPDLKFGGARAEWYKRLLSHNGKPMTEVMADLEANRPSVYGNRSKHAGTPEPVKGWVRFFVKNKYAEIK